MFTLVTFHAHPDDEALLTAGIMAKSVAAGHRVVLVVATAGEVGDTADPREDLGAVRRRELERSAEILGVHRLEVLGYGDSGSTPIDPTIGAGATNRSPDTDRPALFSTADLDETAGRLANILREEHADVLTTYDPHGGYGHPDHVRVHTVGHRAAELAGTSVVLDATINRDLMTAGLALASSLGYEIPATFDPAVVDEWYMPAETLTHAVDVSDHIEQKRASMAAHESQTTSAAPQDRTLALFLSLPDEYFTMAFGTEWFIEKGRAPGTLSSDIFASLER